MKPSSQPESSSTPSQHSRWDRRNISQLAQGLAKLLDASMTIPGTTIKIGLDPLIGLIPGIGDVISNALGSSLLFLATKAGVPRIVIFRMSLNIVLNMIIGAIPGLGDVFSIWFKSNVRNAQLLHRHSQPNSPSIALSDWLYVGIILIGMIILISVALGILWWILSTLFLAVGLTSP